MTICSKCKRPMTKKSLLLKAEEHRLNRVKAFDFMRKHGDHIGRKRKVDYLKIYKLRDDGYSINNIAETLCVSRGSIQHALRIKK